MTKSNRIIEITVAALLAAGLAGAALAQDGAANAAARIKAMATVNSSNGAIRTAVAANDMAAAKTAAVAINGALKGFGALFTPGSESPVGKSRAKAEAFTDKAGLKAQLDKAIADSDALVAATSGTDAAVVTAAAGKLAADCGTCHTAYRGPPVP